MTEVIEFEFILKHDSGFSFGTLNRIRTYDRFEFRADTVTPSFKMYRVIGGTPDNFVEPLKNAYEFILNEKAQTKNYILAITDDYWFTKIK